MKYTYTQKNLTLETANLLLFLLWGTNEDDRIDESQRDEFIKDRIQLYSMLGKDTRISLGVEYVQ